MMFCVLDKKFIGFRGSFTQTDNNIYYAREMFNEASFKIITRFDSEISINKYFVTSQLLNNFLGRVVCEKSIRGQSYCKGRYICLIYQHTCSSFEHYSNSSSNQLLVC